MKNKDFHTINDIDMDNVYDTSIDHVLTDFGVYDIMIPT